MSKAPPELSEGRPIVETMQEMPTDEALVRHAGRYYRQLGARDRAIREEFGIGAVRYWQMTLAVLADPERVAGLPAELWPVVARLKRRIAA